ncbi:DUF4225 domain-containing protein [Enterobacter hormaechei]|uniref:DUF4225 domain-containing protein n=1 Tax=Enterobacter hormaechei TaxID=158836 RepID=UPI002017E7E4|nr:DUF4225 domain-containing protein [Enterobacter hormaechei]
MIVVNGFNTISREAAHNLLGDKQTEGIFADGSMEIAEFLGFSRQQGLGTYKAVTLFSEVYGAYGLRLKGVVSENGIYGHSRFCNTDFDDKLACLNLSGV